MGKVICFANMKGGVGKTTLCVNLAFSVFSSGKKILVVDNDPQFNATSILMPPAHYIAYLQKDDGQTIYRIYEKPPKIKGHPVSKIDPKKFIQQRWYLNRDPKITLDIIPSQIDLYETLRNPSQKEYLLDKYLKKYAQEYDYIFIDCPPTPSVLTLSAFAASDYAIIPVTPDYFSTLGLPQFLGTLSSFKEDLHDTHSIKPLGVVFTRVPRQKDQTTNDSINRVKEALKSSPIKVDVFKSEMTVLKVYEKAIWQSMPVQKVTGRGLRGKSDAVHELNNIAHEMEKKIEELADE